MLNWSNRPEEIRELSLRKEELYREILVEWGIRALPGVAEWLAELSKRRIRCAIGSSTHRLNIDTSLSVLGLEDCFAAIVTAKDVSRGKPDPEVFLTAARRIGVDPSRCVVFEDAFAGIEAAHRGGMKLVAVDRRLHNGDPARQDRHSLLGDCVNRGRDLRGSDIEGGA